MTMYKEVKEWYKRVSDSYPIKKEQMGKYVLSEARISSPGNRVVWIIDSSKHIPIAVIFDANKAYDPLIITMTSTYNRALYRYLLKERGKE